MVNSITALEIFVPFEVMSLDHLVPISPCLSVTLKPLGWDGFCFLVSLEEIEVPNP